MPSRRPPSPHLQALADFFASAESAYGLRSSFGPLADMARAGFGGGSADHERAYTDRRFGLGPAGSGAVTRARATRAALATLDAATGKLLDNNKNPSPKTGQLDNRGSQFYLALYWAQALAAQTEDAALAAHFAPLAKTLADNEKKIVAELNAVQGKPVDIGGYYMPDAAKTSAVMRPSATLNAALEAAAKG